MTNQPFFTKDRDAFIPTPAANGPWDPKSLHGRVIIGLLAFAYCRISRPAFFKKQTLTRATPTLAPDE